MEKQNKIERVTQENVESFESFINTQQNGHMFQTLKWVKVKNPSDWEGFLCKNKNNQIIGCISIMIVHQSNNQTLLYIPRGPICNEFDEDTITELLNATKKLAYQYQNAIIKIDSNVAYENKEFLKLMKKLGFQIIENDQKPTTIQSQYVYRIHLKNKTPDQIFQQFHPNVRYAIRNAERKNVQVEVHGIEKIYDFYHIMQNNSCKNEFNIFPINYYQEILKQFKESARIYIAYQNRLPVGGAIAVRYGSSTWYLYAGTNIYYEKLSPLYLIQWHIINWAIETKSEWYDLGGTGWINDNLDLLPGLSYSKEKMGATRYKLTPGIEYDTSTQTKADHQNSMNNE